MDESAKQSHRNASKRPGEMDQYIGGRLRLWRRTMKIDAYALAATIGITYQQLQKYEKGLNRISAARLHAISRALNVPVSYFFQETENSSAATESGSQQSLMENGGAELLRCFALLKDDTVRKSVLNLLRSIATDSAKNAAPAPTGNVLADTLKATEPAENV